MNLALNLGLYLELLCDQVKVHLVEFYIGFQEFLKNPFFLPGFFEEVLRFHVDELDPFFNIRDALLYSSFKSGFNFVHEASNFLDS